MRSYRATLTGAAGVLLLACTQTAYADEYYWNNLSGGSLSDVSNWDVPTGDPYIPWPDPGYLEAATTAPTYNDELLFLQNDPYYEGYHPEAPESGLSYTVHLDAGALVAANDFIVNSTFLSLQLNGGQLALDGDGPGNFINEYVHPTGQGGNLVVGLYNDLQPSSLTLSDGQVTANQTYVGSGPMANGTLNIADYTELTTTNLILGDHEESSGTLNLQGWESRLQTTQAFVGGFYESSGTVNVDRGVWQTDQLTVGFFGTGTVNVTEGQLYAAETTLGQFGEAVGHLSVSSGPEARGYLETGRLNLGVEGEGHLSVTAGGEVYASWTQVGIDEPTATGSISVSGLGSRFTADVLELGVTGSGSLSVTDGAVAVSGYTYIGNQGGEATGEINVAGIDSNLWANELYIGNGILDISDYGNAQGSYIVMGEFGETNGAINIRGGALDYHSLWTGVQGGSGAITVEAESTLVLDDLYLGADRGSTGSLTVTGDDSFIDINDAVIVGAEGSGTLDINGQAYVLLGSLQIGSQEYGAGMGTATFAGGAEVFAASIAVGNAGSYNEDGSQLTIESDARVSVAGGTGVNYALDINNNSRVDINGGTLEMNANTGVNGNSQLNVNGQLIGSSGSYTEINVGSGSQLNVSATGVINGISIIDVGNNSSMTVDGEVLNGNGYTGIMVSESSTLHANGRIEGFIENSGSVFANGEIYGEVGNAYGGEFTANGHIYDDVRNEYGGLLQGTGVIHGDLFNNAELRPGNSPGHMQIYGDYEQGALGSLIIELAGYDQGINFDFLEVGGDVFLEGLLIVELLDSFIPELGDSFEILTAGHLIDTKFSQLVLPQLAAGMEWAIDYNTGNGDGQQHNVMLNVQASVVPIPGAVWLFASALSLLGWSRRKATTGAGH
jgi:T5SS/PEP-CTERM-associated repeat protein